MSNLEDDEHVHEEERKTEEEQVQEQFFSVSLRKLLILNAFSFGGYVCYWFYRNWKLENERSETKVRPLGRGLFSFLFVHDLFSRIHAQGKTKELEYSWNYNHIATIFALLFVVQLYFISQTLYLEGFTSVMLVRWLLIFLTVLPLVPIQKLCNQLNDDPKGDLNSNFTPLNFFWIIIGSGVWLLNGLGVWIYFLSS